MANRHMKRAQHHMLLGNCMLRQWDTTTHLLEWLKSIPLPKKKKKKNNGPYQTVVRMWSNRNSHSLLVRMQNGTDTLEDSLAISYKSKHTLTIWSSDLALWHVLKWADFLGGPEVRTTLVAQIVKHLPTMRETWVQSLGWKNFLEKEMATHSSISCLENPMDRGDW